MLLNTLKKTMVFSIMDLMHLAWIKLLISVKNVLLTPNLLKVSVSVLYTAVYTKTIAYLRQRKARWGRGWQERKSLGSTECDTGDSEQWAQQIRDRNREAEPVSTVFEQTGENVCRGAFLGNKITVTNWAEIIIV